MLGSLLGILMLLAGAVVTAAVLRGSGARMLSHLGVASRSDPPAPAPRLVRLNWTVSAGTVAPAGGAPTPVLLVNGVWPAPAVELDESDIVELYLSNAQPQPVSVHWHGVAQRGTPRADGAAHASAPPLQQGAAGVLVARFTASPAGTHLWHGHAGLTAAAGLHGPLIVRERDARRLPPYDGEATLLLSDFWRMPLDALRTGLLQRAPAFRWVGDPDALLVNGINANANASHTATVALPRGATVRLRLINAASLSCLSLAAEGHSLRVVQADGADVAPLDAGEVLLNAGERLSVLLTPSPAARAAGVVWLTVAIRHRPHGPFGVVALTLPPENNNDAQSQAATPASSLPAPPAGPLPAQSAWNDTAATVAFYSSLRAAEGAPPPPPPPPGAPLLLRGSQAYVDGLMRWTVNDLAFAYPGDPLLAEGSQGAPPAPMGTLDASDAFPGMADATMLDVAVAAAAGAAPAAAAERSWADASTLSLPAPRMGTSVVTLPLGAVRDVVLLNGAALNGVNEQHPWHLHGGLFWLMGLGEGPWPPLQGRAAPPPAKRPPQRDTLTLPPGGWAWIRIAADNAGVCACPARTQPCACQLV